jgi:FkbM family methyltransferase
MIVKRIVQNLQRRKRAKRFSINFSRLKDFKVPQEVCINHQAVSLSFPEEQGVWSAFVEIFLEDGYCLSRLSKKPIRNIVDIGANIGFFSVCARHYFPMAAITAYEPNHYLEKYLSAHFSQINAVYHMEAVGLQAATISLQFSGNESIMTTVKEDAHASIRQVSFAEVLRNAGNSIDLLKLDCEGAEWQILEDHASMEHVKWIVMEYHLFGKEGATENDMISLLQKHGFNIISMRADNGFGFILAGRENLS